MFLDYTRVVGTDDYSAVKNSNLVVITAGARQLEGETRLDLIAKNRAIFKQIIPKIVKVAPNAILLVVSNPVDVLTYEAYKLSGFPWGRVFGSGTLLDTARLRFHISEKLCLSPKSIEAYILGEHGDTSFRFGVVRMLPENLWLNLMVLEKVLRRNAMTKRKMLRTE